VPRRPVQERLPFPDPPGLVCAAGRLEPVFWVRRVVLWHDVTQRPVRNVQLRRGLNVIWSPTARGEAAVATGHAAGKSLFCRLIRYCLGEDTFADPDDTVSIRERFPSGAVGAEVRVRGLTWAVRRSFGSRRDDRATRADTLDQLADDGAAYDFDAFISELEASAFDANQRSLLTGMPEVDRPWQFLLAWLTRDQECRIDGLTHWRHPDTSSHSPVRHARSSVRLDVLRLALGPYSGRSGAFRKGLVDAGARNERAAAMRRALENRFSSVRDELAHGLRVDAASIWPPPASLLQDAADAVEAHRISLQGLADQRVRAAATVTMDPDHVREAEQLAQLQGEVAGAEARVATARARADLERARVALAMAERVKTWAAYRAANHPVCPFDDTPLDVEASKFKCPNVRLPDPAAARSLADNAGAEAILAQEGLAHADDELQSASGEHATLKSRVRTLAQRVDQRYAAVASATRESQEAWATRGLVHRLLELSRQLDESLRAEDEAKLALHQLQEEQVTALSEHSTADLERWFDFLVRRVVAPEAKGTVVLDGKGLHPRIEWRGTRRSVALNSLQVVLFDLAAMLCAVEGHSKAPAFLIHDSPREGDLDSSTYARIFHAFLELGPDEATAPFQYILTTTTDPPAGPVRSRVRLQIGADTEAARLFQVDL